MRRLCLGGPTGKEGSSSIRPQTISHGAIQSEAYSTALERRSASRERCSSWSVEYRFATRNRSHRIKSVYALMPLTSSRSVDLTFVHGESCGGSIGPDRRQDRGRVANPKERNKSPLAHATCRSGDTVVHAQTGRLQVNSQCPSEVTVNVAKERGAKEKRARMRRCEKAGNATPGTASA